MISTIFQSDVNAIVAGVVIVLGVLVPGIIKVINALKQNTEITVAGQQASASRGALRDSRIQEIHLLVNSRLLTVLRVLVVLTKKEADRTNNADDISAYQQALKDLEDTIAASTTSQRLSQIEIAHQEDVACEAEKKVALLTANVKPAAISS